MNASLINVYQFTPSRCTAAVAQYRLSHMAAWIKAVKERKALNDNQRNATLAALTQANPSLEQDLELLAAAADDSGQADAQIDLLETIQVQFWEALAPEVKASVPRPVV